MKIYKSIIDTIGRTPLVECGKIGKDLPGRIVLKLEFFNPFGSVKDRIALAMIEEAERSGALVPGMQIIEPTSGNTGIGLAFVCAAKSYPITLVMPETMSYERRTLLLMLGANLVLTPGTLGMRGAVAKAQELFDVTPKAFMPRQFENPANPAIHQATTAEEIWTDTEGGVDIVVCGVGTGGTFSGVGTVLKSRKPGLQMVAVEPFESSVISGETPGPHKIQGIGAGFVPQNLDRSLVDSVERVSSEEALAMSRRIIREEGIPLGISSGAAIVAALRLAQREENRGKMIVTIIPSSTERYLSTPLCEAARHQAKALPTAEVNPDYLSASVATPTKC